MKIILNFLKDLVYNPLEDVLAPGKRTARRMDKDIKKAGQFPFDKGRDKLVIFSDLHRGARHEEVDRFRSNVKVYYDALNHYYANGSKLILLGDVEEGWGSNNRMDRIFESYKEIVAMERKFIDDGRYFRVYGNHDDFWRKPKRVDKYFNNGTNGGAATNGKVTVFPALVFEDNGNHILMVHGCQGHNLRDVGDALARFVVYTKFDALKIKSKKEALERREKMRKQEERILDWADRKKYLVIMGHTHTIYFKSLPRAYFEEKAIDHYKELLDGTDFELEKKTYEANIDFLKGMVQGIDEKRLALEKKIDAGAPGVFNSGNCCVSDKEISAVEIGDGMIRLVFWKKGGNGPEVKEEESLDKLFDAIHQRMA